PAEFTPIQVLAFSFSESRLPLCDYGEMVHIAFRSGIEHHQEPLSVRGDVELMEALREKANGEQDPRYFGANAFGAGLNSGRHDLPTTIGRLVVDSLPVSSPLHFICGSIRDLPSPFLAAAIAGERLHIELVGAGIVGCVGNPMPIR